MNSEELNNFRHFINETAANGTEVTKMSHVAEPVKNTVRDLLKICENVTKLLDSNTGQSADTRILKKKYEQIRLEHSQMNKKFEKAQNLLLSLLEDIQDITNSVEMLTKANATQANRTVIHETAKIQKSALTLSTKIMQFNP